MDKKYRLLALFRKGATEGEKKAAFEGLKRICEKEGISLQDFLESEEIMEKIIGRCHNKEEVRMLSQIMYTLYPKQKKEKSENFQIFWYGNFKGKSTDIYFKGTPRQFLEIKYAFDVYKRAMRKQRKEMKERQKKEQENFYDAFLYANNLFPENPDDYESNLDPERMAEMEEIWRQARGLSRTHLHRPLNRGKIESTNLLSEKNDKS